MLYRIWRVIVAVLTLGIIRLEKSTASARRQAIIDGHVQAVAKARTDLGNIRGAGRQQLRTVTTLEERVRTLTLRKNHFMDELRKASPGTPQAQTSEDKARDVNAELKAAQADLATETAELNRIKAELEKTKAIIKNADRTVKASRAKGERMARRQESAERRKSALEAVASIQGLAGATDELARIDAQLEDDLDMTEGQTETVAELANEEWEEQQLDRNIANSQLDDEFERELAAARVANTDVVDAVLVKPALPSGEERTLELPKRQAVAVASDFDE